ncbi:putative ABC transporter ATP-binding/permease protein [Gemmatimonas aurantiaca T-27]|uniref:Putative ABC transporter ATP-binding/permease protein n=1 Tax=Gemmatimonas aurantiaca (strain DSM 14586 / JCM 11422 / NBRC 100505 / T-27) TaxID=379066 RepID=C1AE60_GEMAT|nr:ABC transporter ATP-binding protein [Gemmatimonas aurantiaca]BAH40787.1 putative ABC transporter ATP-binding/permease protein [Gemmatimonas aurantiaca T-27]
MNPPAKGKPKYDSKRAWSEVRALMWEHRRSVGIGLVLMIISRASGFVLPYSTKFVLDDVIPNKDIRLLGIIALAGFAATIVQSVTGYALSQVVSVAAQQAIARLREDVQGHLIRLPVRYFDSTKSGVLVSRVMNDPEGIRNLIGTGLIQLTGGILSAIAALGVLIHLNWRLTLVTVVFLAIFGAGMSVAFKRLRPIFRERSVITAEVTGRLTETLGGIRLVKVYTAEERERAVFGKGVQRLFANIAKTITGTSLTGTLGFAVVGVIGVIAMYVGGRDVITGAMTLGSLLTFVFFIAMVTAPLVQVASIGTQITEAFAGLDRIRELRDMATEDQEDERKQSVPTVVGHVKFDQVSFEYEPGVPVLHDVTFDAPAGTTTALVGSSGSGKSTMISLIMAFAQPQQGRILVDGTPVSDLRLREYRHHLGVVMQDNFLFDGTVKENIAFTKPSATDEEIMRVAQIANAHEFILGFPQGYETIVGERGVKLSGGQRQRVAIARAILADPRVLILDEATLSLDSESEHLIQEGLRRLRAGRTTFVIAHRLSTITSANQILVLEKGQIVERGTHAELLALGGRYRDLYSRQYQMELDQFINPGEEIAATG